MARPKKAHKEERTIKFSKNEFVQAVIDCVRLKKDAAEYSGRHGARVAQFTDKTGFSRQAFKILVGFQKLDDTLKAQSIMDEIVLGFDLLGFNDQGRLFDRAEKHKADKIAPDKGSSDGANVVSFQKDALPLGEVAKKLADNNAKASAKKGGKGKADKAKDSPAPSKKKAAAAAVTADTLGALSEHLPGPGAEDDEAWEQQ